MIEVYVMKTEEQTQINIVKETSKSGHVILKVNDYYLHSRYDPLREAQQIADHQYKRNYLHILFGLGSGYVAKAISQKLSEEEFLIIIEPFEQVFEESKHVVEHLERTILIREQDGQGLKEFLEPFMKRFGKKVRFICSPNYDKVSSESYQRTLKSVKDRLYMEQVNINTIKYFSKEWQKNFTLNLFYAFDDIPFKKLTNYYTVPVVVASGGPSLTKQIPLLKKIREHIILVSSGSTINTLLKHGIEPDYVVTIDGGIKNYEHFESLTLDHCNIIYSLSNHEGILDHLNKRGILFISKISDEIEKYTEKLLNKDVDVLTGGASVANFALNIGYRITSGPIALIGQDLAYTDNQTHAKYNKHYQKITEEYIKQKGLFYTEGYNGDQVLTDYPFYTMKYNFESLLKTFDDPDRIFNCTEGGIKLEGYQQISFKEFCDRYVDQKSRPRPFNLEKYPRKIIDDWRNFLVNIEKEINVHEKVERLLQDGIILLKRNVSKQKFDRKIIKKLDRIDNQLKEIFEDGMMSIISEPIVMDTFNNYLPGDHETELETFQRVYARSMELYSRLQEAANDSRSYFVQLKEKIQYKIKELENEG